MGDRTDDAGPGQDVEFELEVCGRPGPKFLTALGGVDVIATMPGRTRLRGSVRSQAAMVEAVATAVDLGVELVSVRRIDLARGWA